jgi:hypothetical protein
LLLSCFVALSLCRFVALSLGRFVALSLCRFVALSLCRFVALSLCRFVALSLCHFVALSLCHFVALSLCHIVVFDFPIFFPVVSIALHLHLFFVFIIFRVFKTKILVFLAASGNFSFFQNLFMYRNAEGVTKSIAKMVCFYIKFHNEKNITI